MPIGMIFWMLMIIWALFGIVWKTSPTVLGSWGWVPSGLLMFVLFFILG